MKRRMTNQKKIIKDIVEKRKEHYTADEIFLLLSKDNPKISRATVFRNLRILTEDKILKKLEVAGAADRYDINLHHYHAKCIKCDKIYDIDHEYLESIDKTFSDFDIVSHDLILKIVCKDCQK